MTKESIAPNCWFIERFIRKHYKDPLLFDEFRPMLCAAFSKLVSPFCSGGALGKNLRAPDCVQGRARIEQVLRLGPDMFIECTAFIL